MSPPFIDVRGGSPPPAAIAYAAAYRLLLLLPATAAAAGWPSRQVAAAALRLGLADGAGSEGYIAGVVRRPDPPSSRCHRRTVHCFSAALREEADDEQ